MRLVGGLVGVTGLVAALWSGGWFWGKAAIRSGLDEQIAAMRAQGIEASYTALDVEGFPFGYEGRVVEPRYAMAVPVETGIGVDTVTYTWSAPWMVVETWASDAGDLVFAVAGEQTLTVQPPGGAPPVTASIRSENLRARLSQEGGRTRLDGSADRLKVSVREAGDAAAPPVRVRFDGLVIEAEAVPDGEDGIGALRIDARAGTGVVAVDTSDARPTTVALEGLTLAVNLDGGRAHADIAAARSRIDGAGGTVLDIETGPLTGRAQGPLSERPGPQPVALTLDIRDADLREPLWNLLDPSGSFPREIRHITLDAEGEAVLPGPLDDPVTWLRAAWTQATLKTLSAEGLGLEIGMTGQGSVIGGIPEGTGKLRLAGIDGFIANAVKAGLVPQQQAAVYRLMLGTIARDGDAPGEKVFDLALREGLPYINGVPMGSAFSFME